MTNYISLPIHLCLSVSIRGQNRSSEKKARLVKSSNYFCIMQSPVAATHMTPIELEAGLQAFQCPQSNGIFIPISNYSRWIASQPARLPQLPVSDHCVANDSEQAKICPESGLFMSRYKVGKGFEFYLDRSPSGSIWLDAGEWEQLKQHQFHDELHLIFSSSWQQEVRSHDRAKAQRNLLESKLGADLLVQLDQLTTSLQDHEYSNMALAYLQNQLSK